MNIHAHNSFIDKENNLKYHVGYYGGLVLTSEMIRLQRFQIEMEQHFREQQEDHEATIQALELMAKNRFETAAFLLFPVAVIGIAFVIGLILWI